MRVGWWRCRAAQRLLGLGGAAGSEMRRGCGSRFLSMHRWAQRCCSRHPRPDAAPSSPAPVPSARPHPCPRSLKCIRWGEMCVWGAYPRATLVPHVYISHALRPRYRVRGSERRVWNCERRVRGPCECRDGGLVALPGTGSVPSAVNAQFSTEAGTTVGAGHCTRG